MVQHCSENDSPFCAAQMGFFGAGFFGASFFGSRAFTGKLALALMIMAAVPAGSQAQSQFVAQTMPKAQFVAQVMPQAQVLAQISNQQLQGIAADIGGDLRQLSPKTPHKLQQDRPLLRPENKVIPARPSTPATPAVPKNSPQRTDADFDFYVLSLSWSPSFCAQNGNRANAYQQCATGRNFGFVAHGLWPQYERDYPQSCAHAEANAMVPRDLVSALSDIMPSAGLMRHEWRKHGTCAGLSQREYFAALRSAYQRITMPPAYKNVTSARMIDPQLLEKAFITANPGLPANAIAVTCRRNQLEEVRICMDSDMNFRACAQVNRNACRARSVMMLPNR